MTDEIAQSLGFQDADEFFRMVASVPMNTPEQIASFKDWQANDGTKTGLLAMPAPTDDKEGN